MRHLLSARLALFPLFLFLVSLFLAPLSAAQAASQASGRSVRLAEQAFSRATPVPAWIEKSPELPPAVPGSALSARLFDIQFYIDASSTLYVHRALVAGDTSSLGALGQYEVEFQPEYQQLQLHTLRVLRGGAVIDKLAGADIRFLQRETSLDQGIYSGSVTAAIVTEDVRVGDTLEMEYSIIGQNPVFAGKFFHAAAWDAAMPVAQRRVSLNMPERRNIHARLIGGERGQQPVMSSANRDGRRILRFEGRALPQSLPEPYVPNDVHDYRYLQFSEFDNWRDVNQWALGLFASGDTSAALKDVLAPARAAKDKEAAVANVLEFVQNDIRYLSISLGENSHRPFPPEQVLQRRYGDCKDKSLLMVSMLRELGIEAAPVLVSTSQRKGLDKMLPSPLLFDHAIVRAVVNGKEFYFDPTRQGQYGALENMGQVHGGAQVLPIADGVKALAVVGPLPHPSQRQSIRIERVSVKAMDKPVEMVVQSHYEGVGAEYARVQFAAMNQAQIHKAYDGVLGERYPDSSMLGEPVIRDDRTQNRLVVETRYRINNFFDKQAESWNLRYLPSNLTGLFYVPGNAARQFPLALPRGPGAAGYELYVDLPDTFDGRYKDASTDYKSAAFDLNEAFSFKGRTASAKVQLRLNSDRVANNGVVEFLAGLKKFNAVLNGYFVIRKSDLRSAAAASIPPPAAATTVPPAAVPSGPRKSLRDQLEANLATTTRLIADADQLGQDAADPLCERGLVRAYLGKDAEAIEDGGRAVQLRAQSGEVWKCRADIYFVAGKFKEGESDFGRAIARGSDTASAYLGKALSSLYLGKTASAKLDLEHASEKAQDQITRQQMALWQAITVWQAGKAPSAPGAPDAAAGWRQAALAMFEQGQAPDQMLRLASRDAGATVDARLAEAYFYAGKYYQLKQDASRARVYFRLSVEKGVLDNLYHTVSRHELARLSN
jgi:lipoprotein NlpI